MRVVVVDDHDQVRALLRAVLSDAGHVVVAEAPDGRAGVQRVLECRPELVIMDWSMPLMDGVQATRQIRRRCPGVAVIAFSSANDPAVRDAFLDAGAIAYIDKADARGLLARVSELSKTPIWTPPPRSARPRPTSPASDQAFTLHIRSWPALARTHLALRGPLHAGAAEDLTTAVVEHARPGATLVLDLSEITAIDDQGIATLDRCQRLADERQTRLELQDPSPVAGHALARRHRH